MTLDKQPHILVFDSGVGGLSVVEAIKKTMPFCQLTYASDNAQFPYGTKAAPELIARVERVLKSLQKKVSADIIVIACNSASTVVLPKIRSHFLQPIIGVVPAIKPAAKITTNNTIGLLATPGTVNRHYTKKLIADFASHCEIISVGSSELVLLAEKKLQNKPISLALLTEITQPFRSDKNQRSPDTMVLACTHFPLLKNELMSVLPNITHWIDSGDAIARRIQFWIEELSLTTDARSMTGLSTGHSIFTKRTKAVELIKPALAKLNLSHISYMEIG
jgi:glutamate racemase